MPEFNYAETFGRTYHQARRLSEKAERWIAQVRGEKLQKWIGADDRVLEYGVGFGWNLAALRCGEKVGFDLTPGLRDAVERKGIRFETDEAALFGSRFDKIVVHHVLEHVPSPTNLLRSVRELLAQGGKLLLFVPFEQEGKYKRFCLMDGAHHLNSWTQGSLCRLVTRSGWTVEETGINPFRFDRRAAMLTHRVRGGFRLYQMLRRVGLLLFPEFELFLVAGKEPMA